MGLLVSDSSVLIDLERGGLLQAAFQSGHTLIVPDILYQNELEAYNGPYFVSLGLGVTDCTPDEVQMAQDLANTHPALSLEDCFALACATRSNHILLTGDGPLRAAAGPKSVPCKGLLWLLDEMLASGNINPSALCAGLTLVSQHPRCRLPKQEVQKRLTSWC